MAVCGSATSSSSLNPNAPFFVPAAFSAVEDFSSEWWNFIQSSPAFREYWLAERFDPPETELALDFDAIDLLDFEPDFVNTEQEKPVSTGMDLKDFARLAGWQPEDTAAKLARRPFSSLPSQSKPLKVTQPQKPGMRKIQQPR